MMLSGGHACGFANLLYVPQIGTLNQWHVLWSRYIIFCDLSLAQIFGS